MSARSKLVKYLTVVEILQWKLISQLLRVSKTLLESLEGRTGNLFFGQNECVSEQGMVWENAKS